MPTHTLASPDDGAQLTGLADWAVTVMDALGAPGAGVLVAAENLFPPLPSELILPLAGFTASQGGMSLAAALIWTTIGSLVGAIALYWIGRAFGRRRMYWIVHRMPLVDVEDLLRTEEWFDRHGSAGIFFGRMVPIFRSLISIPAGIEKMPILRFALLTTAGSAIWNTIFVVAGYVLGENWQTVETYAGTFQTIVIVVVVVAVVWWVTKRVLRNRRGKGDQQITVEEALERRARHDEELASRPSRGDGG